MTDIILAGNAVCARILYGYLAQDQRYNILGCVVDDAFVDKSGLPVLPCVGLSAVTERFPPERCRVLMALGYAGVNSARRGMFERLLGLGYAMETYIHPRAVNCTANAIGQGSVIMPGALLEPGASIGADCFIWGNAVIAHDATVGSHCWIAAGAVISGMAKIGESCFVGVNATVANKVEAGAGAIIGGAAFISRNIRPDTVHLARSAEAFRGTAQEYAKYFGL